MTSDLIDFPLYPDKFSNLIFLYIFVTEKILGHTEKQRYDGWYNNLAHPDWGAVGKSANFVNYIVNDNYLKRDFNERLNTSFMTFLLRTTCLILYLYQIHFSIYSQVYKKLWKKCQPCQTLIFNF